MSIKFFNQTKTQQLNSQIFIIWSDEIEGRIDPYYFHPVRLKTIEKVRSSKFDLILLKEIVNFRKEIVDRIPEKMVYVGLEDIESNTGQYIGNYSRKENISSGFVFRKRDVLFPKLRPYLNKVFHANFDGICSTEFHVLEAKKCNPFYLYCFLGSKFIVNQTTFLMTGNTLPRLQTDDIKNLQIPLPPLPTQNKIVSIMSKAYDEKERKEIKSEEILNSIDDFVLKELKIKMPEIEKEMVFEVWSDEAEGSRIDTEYWQPYLEKVEQSINSGKYKTEKLKNYITKIHYGASTSNAYVDDGIPLLRILNLKPNNLDLSKVVYLPESFRKELGSAFVKTGELLISRSGTVGIVAVTPKEADGFAFGSFIIKFCLDDKINKKFVSIWLNNRLNKLLTERKKIGAIQGNITISTIGNFNIPIPPLSIQKKIAEKIELYYSQAKTLQKEAKEVLENAKQKVEQMSLGEKT